MKWGLAIGLVPNANYIPGTYTRINKMTKGHKNAQFPTLFFNYYSEIDNFLVLLTRRLDH